MLPSLGSAFLPGTLLPRGCVNNSQNNSLPISKNNCIWPSQFHVIPRETEGFEDCMFKKCLLRTDLFFLLSAWSFSCLFSKTGKQFIPFLFKTRKKRIPEDCVSSKMFPVSQPIKVISLTTSWWPPNRLLLLMPNIACYCVVNSLSASGNNNNSVKRRI